MRRFAGKNSPSIEPSVDVILMVLNAAHAARPEATLISSLLHQYKERGGLSKKQLEGLHSKASKIEGISAAHLATLEAIILKRPTRFKQEIPTIAAPKEEDTHTPLIESILHKYPAHKRILYFKMKLENREQLTPLEKDELVKFGKLLLK
jgi:hypothetical protein